jgi:hypothetical protein
MHHLCHADTKRSVFLHVWPVEARDVSTFVSGPDELLVTVELHCREPA